MLSYILDGDVGRFYSILQFVKVHCDRNHLWIKGNVLKKFYTDRVHCFLKAVNSFFIEKGVERVPDRKGQDLVLKLIPLSKVSVTNIVLVTKFSIYLTSTNFICNQLDRCWVTRSKRIKILEVEQTLYMNLIQSA